MTKEQLIEMGLTEEQASKVMESLNGSFVTKKRFDEVNDLSKQLKEDLKDRDKQLDELKKVDAAGLQDEIKKLQDANKATQDAFEVKVKQIQIENAVEKALLVSKAKNIKAVKALLDLDNAELDGENIKGLEDQIKKLQEGEDTKFLFDIDDGNKQSFKGVKPGEAKDGGGSGNVKPTSLAEAIQSHLTKN